MRFERPSFQLRWVMCIFSMKAREKTERSLDRNSLSCLPHTHTVFDETFSSTPRWVVIRAEQSAEILAIIQKLLTQHRSRVTHSAAGHCRAATTERLSGSQLIFAPTSGSLSGSAPPITPTFLSKPPLPGFSSEFFCRSSIDCWRVEYLDLEEEAQNAETVLYSLDRLRFRQESICWNGFQLIYSGYGRRLLEIYRERLCSDTWVDRSLSLHLRYFLPLSIVDGAVSSLPVFHNLIVGDVVVVVPPLLYSDQTVYGRSVERSLRRSWQSCTPDTRLLVRISRTG